ncbi:MAG TPA: GtrA family protein [Chitinispirillaceae bacterium]|nr:GtrA family protein [Chitinispirillaceae bacterium]
MKVFLFLVSSATAGLIYMSLLYVCNDLAKLNPILSVTISYGSAMALYFVANKLVIFRIRDCRRLFIEITQFIIMVGFNYLITVFIVNSCLRVNLNVYYGSLIAGIVTTLITYVIFEKILFKKPEVSV